MAKLYEINREIEDLISANTDPDTGMINPDIQDALFSLELEREQKLLAIGKFIKNLESEAAEHIEEKKRQDHKAKVLQRKADRLREYIQWNLKENESVKDTQVDISFSNRVSLLIDRDVIEYPHLYIPKWCLTEKITQSIDKKALLEMIKLDEFSHPKVSIKYNLIIK